MTRTVTAMFDTRADAEAGQARLKAAGIDEGNVNVHDQTTAGYENLGSSTAGSYSTGGTATAGYDDTMVGSGSGATGVGTTDTRHDQGIWSSIKHAFLPDEDRTTYEEGIRRGHAVLSVDVSDEEVDKAVRALEDSHSIDIDERAGQWRSEGWTGGYGAGATGTMASEPDLEGAFTPTGLGGTGSSPTSTIGATATGLSSGGMGSGAGSNDFVYGRRDTDYGSARVRSYSTDRTVVDQIKDGVSKVVDKVEGISN